MAIELYLDIEKVRFSDRLSVEFSIAPEAYRCSVPSLLLQPIVENAIKYAIAQSEQGGTISVAARVQANQLVLSIDDSGPDQSAARATEHAQGDDLSGVGIGLQNMNERLMTLYGEQFSVKHEPSALGGRSVSISLPATGQFEMAS